MKVFLRFYDDCKENITVNCDWVYVAPDYISPYSVPIDNCFAYTVRCYNTNDKDFVKIYSEVLDVEVI